MDALLTLTKDSKKDKLKKKEESRKRRFSMKDQLGCCQKSGRLSKRRNSFLRHDGVQIVTDKFQTIRCKIT